MLPEMILRLRYHVVNGLKLVTGISGTGCLLLYLRSFQLPLQSLQRGGSFVCANHGLAVFAVADAHQNGDILESLLDKREITTELNCLVGCERAHIF
jgi:hypothetical protein